MSKSLESMNLEQLRKAADKLKVPSTGTRALLIARLAKHANEEKTDEQPAATDANTAADETQSNDDSNADTSVNEPTNDSAAPAADPGDSAPVKPAKVAAKPAAEAATRVCYKPVSAQTLNLAGLIVPGEGVTFDAPNPEYDAFVPYFLSRTDVPA